MDSSRIPLTKAKLADAEIVRGQGGETHQTAERGADVLTTQSNRLSASPVSCSELLKPGETAPPGLDGGLGLI